MNGSCLCGAVTYEVTGDPMMTGYCHCSRCRRATGAGAAAVAIVATDTVTVTAGQDQIETFRPEGWANRSFCKTCGSTLFAVQWPDGPMTAVPLGGLDGDPGVVPQMHIHVASKADWNEITDGLKQFPELPG